MRKLREARPGEGKVEGDVSDSDESSKGEERSSLSLRVKERDGRRAREAVPSEVDQPTADSSSSREIAKNDTKDPPADTFLSLATLREASSRAWRSDSE